jgi:26S proteasome regulatory subunit N1
MLTEIRSSTSSMTSVPKPLKFLRPHFAPLKTFFEALADSEIKVCPHFSSNLHFFFSHLMGCWSDQTLLADVLSVLAMTMGAEDKRESLKFRLLGSKQDISSWGHEYIRYDIHHSNLLSKFCSHHAFHRLFSNLTGEVSAEFQSLEGSTQHLDYLIQQIVAFYLTHSGECDACDLLAEVDKLELMMPYLQASTVAKDVDTLERIGAYLARCASYEGDAEDRDQYVLLFL